MKSGRLWLCSLIAFAGICTCDAACLTTGTVGLSTGAPIAQLSVPGVGREGKLKAPRVLTIPEPSTYALAAGTASLALCAWIRRRKKG